MIREETIGDAPVKTCFGLCLQTAKRITIALAIAGAFLAGRAYGWYEAHLYMKHIAEGLTALTGLRI